MCDAVAEEDAPVRGGGAGQVTEFYQLQSFISDRVLSVLSITWAQTMDFCLLVSCCNQRNQQQAHAQGA